MLYATSDTDRHRLAPLLPGRSVTWGRPGDYNRRFFGAVNWIARNGGLAILACVEPHTRKDSESRVLPHPSSRSKAILLDPVLTKPTTGVCIRIVGGKGFEVYGVLDPVSLFDSAEALVRDHRSWL